MSATKPKYVIEVVYLGERVDLLDTIRQTFRDKKGRLYRYNGIKHVWFGECYRVTKEGSIAIRPERVEKPTLEATEKDRLEYEAQKEICKYVRAKNRKALELKKPHPDIVKAIELLRPFARAMDNLALGRFTRYLENQLSKPTKRRR